MLVQVRGAGQAAGELAERRALPTPEVPDRVAVVTVPLRPQRREVADLVAALAQVPRLGDELHLADDRVLLDEVEERAQPGHLVELSGEGGGEVEAEAVDVHLRHPVAQRVHDQLKHVRVPHEQAVPGAGGVVVEVLRVVDQAVVGLVVQALEAQRRAHLVSLGGVVVDDVEDDLDACLVHRLDHALELLDLLTALASGGVLVVRGEEADRVVAPVVAQAAFLQVAVLHELMYRHELERRDAEVAQVVDHHRVRHPRVGPADALGDAWVLLGHALDVRLVDDRLVVVTVGRPVVTPVEVRVDHDRVHGVQPGVQALDPVVVATEAVAEQRLVRVRHALDGFGVRVQQQLAGVAAQALARVVRPVHPIAVALAGLHTGQVAVPDEAVDLGHLDAPSLAAGVVQEAQLDLVGDLGEDGEVRAHAVVGGPQGVGVPGPDVHACSDPLERMGADGHHGGSRSRSQALERLAPWPSGGWLRRAGWVRWA